MNGDVLKTYLIPLVQITPLGCIDCFDCSLALFLGYPDINEW